MEGREDLSKGADGFRVEDRYLLAGSDVPYRVTVSVEYPATDDLAHAEDPFHEGLRVQIENMVLSRLLDEVTRQARKTIHEYFRVDVVPSPDLC